VLAGKPSASFLPLLRLPACGKCPGQWQQHILYYAYIILCRIKCLGEKAESEEIEKYKHKKKLVLPIAK